MDYQFLILAISLGLFSSFHCVGMCGAIAFSLPVANLKGNKKILGILLYNLGRVATYSFFGLVFGFIGRQIFVAGIQQWFTIIAGIILLMIVGYILLSKRYIRLNLFKNNRFIYRFMGERLGSKGILNSFIIGLANGFLPCGMVYLAITGAIASGTIVNSVLFMAFFGLGTIPAMFALNLFGFVAGLKARNFFKKSTPFVMAFMGVLLILRGLNLDIPFVSPNIGKAFTSGASCH